MFPLQDLQIIWWFIIGVVMIIYASTAGYDYGATMIMPFMRKEKERQVVLSSVARTWDGNQTWLVFFGGALFVTWPMVYGAIFSGFYAAMLIILWSLFFRPPGFDYRDKIETMKWRRAWDVGLFVSSLLPTFAFGLAIGNIMAGVPLYFDEFMLRPMYGGDFWGLVNWFGIVCGLVSVAMSLMNASAYFARRIDGVLKNFFKKLHTIFSIIFLVLFTGAGFMVAFYVRGYFLTNPTIHPFTQPFASVVTSAPGGWIQSYAQYPWKAYAPVLAYFGVLFSMLLVRVGNGTMGFWASVIGITGIVATFGTAMYPFVVPSNLQPNESLTLWNAATGYYKLDIMLYVAVVILFLILLYKIFAFYSVWADKKTVSIDDLGGEDHRTY